MRLIHAIGTDSYDCLNLGFFNVYHFDTPL
jgi:hypothetical protein